MSQADLSTAGGAKSQTALSQRVTGCGSLLVTYTDGLQDPPARNAADSLVARGYAHTTLHRDTVPGSSNSTASFRTLDVPKYQFRGVLRPVAQLGNWLRFRRDIAGEIRRRRPDVLVTIMLHALAALPKDVKRQVNKHVACVYDIPLSSNLGRLDRRIVSSGWARLREADVVWSSDVYKAEWAREFGKLDEMPIVCHNCPPTDYLSPSESGERDPWLRQQLRAAGAPLGDSGGCIVLRAGAIGEYGGIEETIAAMDRLPEDLILLLMGRPPSGYKTQILAEVEARGLTRRVHLWDCPNDETWQRALLGADVGHLIQGPFPPGPYADLYRYNSSLSNNRLFQYMAAELPILSYDDPRMSSMYSAVDAFSVVRHANLTNDLREAMLSLYANPSLRIAKGAAGREAHLTKYNWEHQFAPILAQL